MDKVLDDLIAFLSKSAQQNDTLFNVVLLETKRLKEEGYLLEDIEIRDRFKHNFQEIYNFIKVYNLNYLTYLEYVKDRIYDEPLKSLLNPNIYINAIIIAIREENKNFVVQEKYQEIVKLIVLLSNSVDYIINKTHFITRLLSVRVDSKEKYKKMFKLPLSKD